MNRFGFDEARWESAKIEAKQTLSECAKQGQMIPYSEFVGRIRSITLQAHDPRLAHFLEEISMEENSAGRGMLTALVVHKRGDQRPGPGFFDLAERLGHNTADIDRCWIEEVNKVFASWTGSQ